MKALSILLAGWVLLAGTAAVAEVPSRFTPENSVRT
jgi:hypothetical protein